MNPIPRFFFLLLTAILVLCVSTAVSQQSAPSAANTSATDALVNDLKTKSAADPQLKPLGDELGTKVSALSKSLGTNAEAQGQLQSAVKSLQGNQGGASLSSLQKLTQSKLTPEQTTLAKDVYHSGSAYLFQKNFGSLEGSQSEVSQVVGALKKGSATEALAPLKKIGQNAKLTQPQKDLVSSLTDQYAPGLKKAGDALKNIPGFKKSETTPTTENK